MNAKGVLISVMCIALVAMLAGAGTLAYFSDTEKSTGNTFADGTFDLKIRDSNEDWSDGVTATWTLSNMKPGDTKYAWVELKNAGNIKADHLEITCSYSVTEEVLQTESDTDPNTDAHPDEMAKNMIIKSFTYENTVCDIDCLTGYDEVSGETRAEWRIDDMDDDGKITLYDLKQDPLDDLPASDDIEEEFQVRMRLKFDENAGNDFQGDTFNLTMIFTLNQDSSQ